MSWLDRLQEAAITTAVGQRITFDFEDVSFNETLRGSAFEFPDANGTLIQRTGNSGRRYPLRVFIHGENYDLDAAEFISAVESTGIMVLEHPVYGTVNVVPFGDISQRDALKTAANQAVIEVTFWNTIAASFPSSQGDPASAVSAAVSEYNDAAADEFEETINLDSIVSQQVFKPTYLAILNASAAVLRPIAETTEAVEDQFNNVYDSINLSIDLLVADPLTLAFQTAIFLQSPARAEASINDRLVAFAALADLIISSDQGTSNEFHNQDLYASTYVSSAVTSVINNTFETRTGAIEAAEFIIDLMDRVTNWRDDNYRNLGQVDTGGQYQQLQEAVAIAAGFLVDISFTLKQERRIVLDRNRTTLDLCAELYSSTDEVLDFFAESNDLAWHEYIEIEKGRTIVYYI